MSHHSQFRKTLWFNISQHHQIQLKLYTVLRNITVKMQMAHSGRPQIAIRDATHWNESVMSSKTCRDQRIHTKPRAFKFH